MKLSRSIVWSSAAALACLAAVATARQILVPKVACTSTPTDASGDVTTVFVCASGATRQQAYDNVSNQVGDLPEVGRCDNCDQMYYQCWEDIQIYAPDEDHTIITGCDRINGVWVCCATIPQGSIWETICECSH